MGSQRVRHDQVTELNWYLYVPTMKVKVAQSCPALCDPMDYTVRGILQARILVWVAFPFSRGLPNPGIKLTSSELQMDSFSAGHKGSPRIPEWVAYHYTNRSSQPRVSCIAGTFFTNQAIKEALINLYCFLLLLQSSVKSGLSGYTK